MRKSGILMHISSLPGSEGIGTLGPEARAFADFLQKSGIGIWQVLPCGPIGFGESPYQSSSVFAGNPLLISIEELRSQDILSCEDSDIYHPERLDVIDYEAVRQNKAKLLRMAFEQCEKRGRLRGELDQFCDSRPWLADYALFTALKGRFDERPWQQWPDQALRMRRPAALKLAQEELKTEIRYHSFVQLLFYRQWFALRNYCNSKGISMFGDMPIYVAADSADAWTHPEVFQFDAKLMPKRVAGVPPDYFSEDGQLWGNPLYRWFNQRLHGYDWWIARMNNMASMYDFVRVDHFIGFANYYSIPYGAPNARNGRWVIGPGKSLFKALRKSVVGLNIVAEDLGEVNDRVRRLLKWTGFPGMRVLCFGFGDDKANPHHPSNYVENCVVYTGTHDNDTVSGWYRSCDEKTKQQARELCGFENENDASWAMINKLFSTCANTAIVQMQDLLNLGSEARMNKPGIVGGNWLWRMLPDAADKELSDKIFRLNEQTGRLLNSLL